MKLVPESSKKIGEDLWWGVLGRLTGTELPNYYQLHWRRLDISHVFGNQPWPEWSSDPDAGYSPRSWKKIGIMSVKAAALEAAMTRSPELREAVAYEAHHGIRVGQLPEGVEFGTRDSDELDSERSVGLRIGRSTLSATMGLWAPGHDFVALAGVREAGTVYIDSLNQQRLRGFPVVGPL